MFTKAIFPGRGSLSNQPRGIEDQGDPEAGPPICGVILLWAELNEPVSGVMNLACDALPVRLVAPSN